MIHQAVKSAFEQMQWQYRKAAGTSGVIESEFEAEHSKLGLHVQSFEELNALNIVSRSSVEIPDSHKAVAAELLMKANMALSIGALEMDWKEGVALFRASNIFTSKELNGAEIDIIIGLVQAAIAEIDNISPCLGVLIKTPAEELNKKSANIALASLPAQSEFAG